jgi:hypothetical protein
MQLSALRVRVLTSRIFGDGKAIDASSLEWSLQSDGSQSVETDAEPESDRVEESYYQDNRGNDQLEGYKTAIPLAIVSFTLHEDPLTSVRHLKEIYDSQFRPNAHLELSHFLGRMSDY